MKHKKKGIKKYPRLEDIKPGDELGGCIVQFVIAMNHRNYGWIITLGGNKSDYWNIHRYDGNKPKYFIQTVKIIPKADFELDELIIKLVKKMKIKEYVK